MSDPVIFLSFGGGVQSSVMLMLAIHGEIERPDHVIFADTGWESKQTLTHVEWSRRQCEKAGIPFHVVGEHSIYDDARAYGSGESGLSHWASIPLFVDTDQGGQIRRQCTSEYKITPIRKKQRELLGYEKGQRIPVGSAVVQIGISTDEARRASPSRERWVDNAFPLIDPMKMSRADCQAWWETHYPHRQLAKSSCVGCPYKSDAEWRRLKADSPDEWAQVVEFDQAIRVVSGMRGKSYLHRSVRPIDAVDLNESQGGFDLEDAIYCAGGCGL